MKKNDLPVEGNQTGRDRREKAAAPGPQKHPIPVAEKIPEEIHDDRVLRFRTGSHD